MAEIRYLQRQQQIREAQLAADEAQSADASKPTDEAAVQGAESARVSAS